VNTSDLFRGREGSPRSSPDDLPLMSDPCIPGKWTFMTKDSEAPDSVYGLHNWCPHVACRAVILSIEHGNGGRFVQRVCWDLPLVDGPRFADIVAPCIVLASSAMTWSKDGGNEAFPGQDPIWSLDMASCPGPRHGPGLAAMWCARLRCRKQGSAISLTPPTAATQLNTNLLAAGDPLAEANAKRSRASRSHKR